MNTLEGTDEWHTHRYFGSDKSFVTNIIGPPEQYQGTSALLQEDICQSGSVAGDGLIGRDGILVETLESDKSLADIDGIAALCLGEDPAFLEVTQTLEQLGERCITSEEPQVAVFADEATLADDKSFADNLEPTRNWADDGILVETLESDKSFADIDGSTALCLGEDPAFLEVTQTLEQLGERCITSEEPQAVIFADEATLANDKSFADNLERT